MSVQIFLTGFGGIQQLIRNHASYKPSIDLTSQAIVKETVLLL
jgi:hypothetical protein